MHDFRLAIRTLRKSPGFTFVTMLTMALALAVTTAIFTVVHSVVIKPLAYPNASALFWIDQPVPKYDAQHPWSVSEAGYWDYAANVTGLAAVGAFSTADANVLAPEGSRRVGAALATASLLEVLGARPALGRLYSKADDRPGADAVALLSYNYWHAAFGADRGVVGRVLRINDRPVTVIGVLAPGFRLPDADPELWLPAQLDPAAPPQNSHYLGVVGRLAPGATPASLDAELNRRVARFGELYPRAYWPGFIGQFGFRAEALPLREHVVGEVAARLWILLAAVGLVLLIACANVANLFLVRTEGRRRELAMRAALGAGRGRLARHYMSESLLLTLLAGGLGLLIANACVRLLLALKPAGLPRLQDVGVGGPAIAFCLGAAALGGVVLGLFPVLRSKVDYRALREGAHGLTASVAARRVRGSLIVGQVGLAVLLVAAAGLLLRTFERLRAVDPGADVDEALTLEVALPTDSYRGYDETTAFWRAALERLGALPGVVAVGAGQALPVEDGTSCAVMGFEGSTPETAAEGKCIPKAMVTPGYFQGLGIQLRGRAPDWGDLDRASGAVVVTRTLAARLWPGQDPVGKGIRPNGPGATYYRVVGVTESLHMDGLDKPPTPMVFYPIQPATSVLSLWGPPGDLSLIVRTRTRSPQALTSAIRNALAGIDPSVAVGAVRTMREVVSQSMARTTFTLLLLGLAGGMALALAAVGIYGVIGYLVARRRSEIGVRMALGASAASVRRLVVLQSLRTAVLGVGLGLLAALLLGRLLRSLLYGVSPSDPLTLLGAGIVILGASVIASLVPAVRAGRVDLMSALRCE